MLGQWLFPADQTQRRGVSAGVGAGGAAGPTAQRPRNSWPSWHSRHSRRVRGSRRPPAPRQPRRGGARRSSSHCRQLQRPQRASTCRGVGGSSDRWPTSRARCLRRALPLAPPPTPLVADYAEDSPGAPGASDAASCEHAGRVKLDPRPPPAAGHPALDASKCRPFPPPTHRFQPLEVSRARIRRGVLERAQGRSRGRRCRRVHGVGPRLSRGPAQGPRFGPGRRPRKLGLYLSLGLGLGLGLGLRLGLGPRLRGELEGVHPGLARGPLYQREPGRSLHGPPPWGLQGGLQGVIKGVLEGVIKEVLAAADPLLRNDGQRGL